MRIGEIDSAEASIDRAIRRSQAIGAMVRGRRDDGRAVRSLFARLGASLPDLDALSRADCGADLPRPLRARLAERLEAERRRLGRLGKAGNPRYDAGRHLSVRGAIRWMNAGAPSDDRMSEPRLPGSALNRLFGGRGRRRDRRIATAAAPASPVRVCPTAPSR